MSDDERRRMTASRAKPPRCIVLPRASKSKENEAPPLLLHLCLQAFMHGSMRPGHSAKHMVLYIYFSFSLQRKQKQKKSMCKRGVLRVAVVSPRLFTWWAYVETEKKNVREQMSAHVQWAMHVCVRRFFFWVSDVEGAGKLVRHNSIRNVCRQVPLSLIVVVVVIVVVAICSFSLRSAAPFS